MSSWFRNTTISSVLSGVAAVVGAVLALILTAVDSSKFVEFRGIKLQFDQSEPAKTLAETEKLRGELSALRADIRNVASLPKDTKLALQLQQTQKAIKDMIVRQERLEQVILANPMKALEIPHLQRDLENIKAAQQASLVAMKDGVDRIYDLNKWLLGAMAISIVTLALSNFLKGKETESPKP